MFNKLKEYDMTLYKWKLEAYLKLRFKFHNYFVNYFFQKVFMINYLKLLRRIETVLDRREKVLRLIESIVYSCPTNPRSATEFNLGHKL